MDYFSKIKIHVDKKNQVDHESFSLYIFSSYILRKYKVQLLQKQQNATTTKIIGWCFCCGPSSILVNTTMYNLIDNPSNKSF